MDVPRIEYRVVKITKPDQEPVSEWLVVYTTPRAEKRVYERLCEEGVHCYLPLYTTLRQWKDRRKKVELPLFNSYIFVKVTERERYDVLQVQGVLRFLFFLGKPAVVRQKEIDAIKRFLNKTQGYRIKVEAGQDVEIAGGPLEGVYGKVLRVGRTKLVLQIEQMGVSVVAELDRGQVRQRQ
ncbi:MAG: UpxY family transcription antiterminator [Bacteroidales bacterium]|nr:UpxY family transcription antiterminator [Bacteroidales bacterium]